MEMLLCAVPVLIGLVCALWFGRAIFLALLADPEPFVPGWLEGWMPLKGRWLRGLLAAPAILFAMAMVWLGVSGLLVLGGVLVWATLTSTVG
jgi:hypothetical protein